MDSPSWNLVQWLVDELNLRNDVPKRLARRWVDTDQILPLLDGLDEVNAAHRDACVEAINHFRGDHGLVPMAVCSRIADYEALSRKLQLREAIFVQPLTTEQVNDYIHGLGSASTHLQTALQSQPSFMELLQMPLLLSIAALAYRDVAFHPTSSVDDPAALSSDLFSTLVQAMFQRPVATDGGSWPSGQTVRWLSWLASALMRNKVTIFYFENLSQLVPRHLKWLSIAIGGLLVGLLVELNKLYIRA